MRAFQVSAFLVLVVCASGQDAVTRYLADNAALSNAMWRVATEVGGPTNGVTAATATNIAQAVVEQALASGSVPLASALPDGATVTNLQFYSRAIWGDTSGSDATNLLTFDGYGSIVYQPTDVAAQPVHRWNQSIDLQFARYEEWQTATPGNAVLWGVANRAGDGVSFQDNAVIVNGTENINFGLESTILGGIHSRIWTNTVNNGVIVHGNTNQIYGPSLYAHIYGGLNNTVQGEHVFALGSNITLSNTFWKIGLGFATNILSISSNNFVTAEGNLTYRGNAGGLSGLTNLWGLGATNSLTVVNGVMTNRARATADYAPAWDIDTLYTNRNQEALLEVGFGLSNILGDATPTEVYIHIDQDHDGIFDVLDKKVGHGGITTETFYLEASAHLEPRARFMFATSNGFPVSIQVQAGRIYYK